MKKSRIANSTLGHQAILYPYESIIESMYPSEFFNDKIPLEFNINKNELNIYRKKELIRNLTNEEV